MSNWTHVAAVVRVDFINFPGMSRPDFDRMFGKECLFESSSDVWDDLEHNPESYLPAGSEGTLKKSVWINPDRSCTAAYTVSIFGDLRDHDDPNEIIEWFKNKLSSQDVWVRQACITVNNDRNDTKFWQYEPRRLI